MVIKVISEEEGAGESSGTVEVMRASAELLDRPVEFKERAEHDGYLWLRGLLNPAEVTQVRGVVAAACTQLGWLVEGSDPLAAIARPGATLSGSGWDDPQWLRLQQLVLANPSVLSLGTNPALLRVLTALLGGPLRTGQGTVCRVALPGDLAHTTPAHQDFTYVGGSEHLWIAWIPLGPCPLEVGPIAVWPGSHRDGPRPHDDQDGRPGIVDLQGARWVSADLEAGDVILMNTLVVHRALPNASGVLRLSVDFRFEPSTAP